VFRAVSAHRNSETSNGYKEELQLEGVWSSSALCSQLLVNRVGRDTVSERDLQNNTGHSHFEQSVVNLRVETLQERNEFTGELHSRLQTSPSSQGGNIFPSSCSAMQPTHLHLGTSIMSGKSIQKG